MNTSQVYILLKSDYKDPYDLYKGYNQGHVCVSVHSVASVMSDSETLMNCSQLDSSVPGIFQARILEWVAIAFSESVAGHVLIENLSQVSHGRCAPPIFLGDLRIVTFFFLFA